MKRYIFILAALLSAGVLPAQDLGVWEYTHDTHAGARHLTRQLVRTVKNALARHTKPQQWLRQVQQQTYAAVPQQPGDIRRPYLVLPAVPVPANIAPVYTQRVSYWNRALQEQAALPFFKIKTPRPQDVAAMSTAESAYIALFLQGSQSIYPLDIQTYQRYLVKVTLQEPHSIQLIHLIFNGYTREVYPAYGDPHLPGVVLEELPAHAF